MLSLTSLGSGPQETRIATEAKGKTRPAEDHRSQGDFAAYMAAMAQPQKLDTPVQSTTRSNETTALEKATPAQSPATAATANEPAQMTAQKAGNEPAAERAEPAAAARDAKPERESSEIKGLKSQTVRSEKELLEALGLTLKKPGVNPNAAVQQVLRVNPEAQATLGAQQKPAVTKADKSQVAAQTLQQLQKAPDLILANAEGLKRLGEKLGLAFLGKVGEKLADKPAKAESGLTQTKTELRPESAVMTTTAKVQKAGDGHAEQQAAFQNGQKSSKSTPVKNVSRETIAAEIIEKPAPLGGSDLKPVSLPDTATGRLSTTHIGEPRLAESVATVRATENIRAAVENPMLRADLVRQLSEVMTRAQVLVTDSQNAQFSVKLYPRELGRMEIDLKMVEGEIRGKIVVETEDVKNEMQNYLQQRDQSGSEQIIDLNRIDIEVRSGTQHAHNPERTPDADELLRNLVTRTAANTYEMNETTATGGAALYA